MTQMWTVDDLRRRARMRVPRLIFDFIDGGAGNEEAVLRNRSEFEAIRLVPHMFSPANTPDLSTTLFGRSFKAPFGVTPMGLGNAAWPGTDIGLAKACAKAGIPYSLSTVGSTRLERMVEAAPGHVFFQLYHVNNDRLLEDLLKRCEASGVDTLIFTVDANLPGRRLRDRRNGFALPFRYTPKVIFDCAIHPLWSLSTLKAGIPLPDHLAGSSDNGGIDSQPKMVQSLTQARIDYPFLEKLRARWKGNLVVKGIMHPADAIRVKNMGCDGIVVSNHGGRQLASTISTIAVLPAIRKAVGPDFTVLIDSGMRSGEDIARALAMGANFCLLGRPFLFATAALGPDKGANAVISILRDELTCTMQQLGCQTLADLNADIVWSPEHGNQPAA